MYPQGLALERKAEPFNSSVLEILPPALPFRLRLFEGKLGAWLWPPFPLPLLFRLWKLVITWWRCSWAQIPTAEVLSRVGASCVLKSLQPSYLQTKEGRWSLQRIWRWLLSCKCPQKGKVPSWCSSSPKIAPRLVPLSLQRGGVVGCAQGMPVLFLTVSSLTPERSRPRCLLLYRSP